MAGLLATMLMRNSAGIYPPVRGSASTRRKRRKVARVTRAKVARAKKKRTARAGKRPARLVKGSLAAKRYMASIRRKRRR